MLYRVIRDSLFDGKLVKKGAEVHIPEGVPPTPHMVPASEVVPVEEKIEPEKQFGYTDGLEELTRAQLGDLANEEEISIPSNVRTKGDMINIIRKFRAIKGA